MDGRDCGTTRLPFAFDPPPAIVASPGLGTAENDRSSRAAVATTAGPSG